MPADPRRLGSAARAACFAAERAAARTRAALDALPASTREAMEGFRPGAYLRVVLESAPCEWVKNFDPKRPILVGGLLAGENVVGMQQLR